MADIVFREIGHIETPFIDKFGTPRQGALTPASLARVVLKPEFRPQEMLEGLETFSHLWLISYFHRNENTQTLTKVAPPRLGGKTVGVLATRSPHHPNPIGLTLARIEKVNGNEIWVSGVDLVDGTPILDIKPYLATLESVADAKDGWVAQHPWPTHEVHFTKRFERALAQILTLEAPPVDTPRFLAMIRESLQQDPRPRAEAEDPQRSYWLRLYDFDIEFRCEGSQVRVEFIRFAFHSPKYPLFEFKESDHQ